MKTTNKNLQIVIEALQVIIGIRLIRQVLCVILLIFDVDEKKIMSELNVSYNTLKKYSSLLNTGKLAELFKDNTYRRKSEMEDYREEIMAELDKKPVRTLREAAVIIENATGLKRSLPQVRNFLKKNGYKPLKVGFIPAKANAEGQRNFLEIILKPLISLAQKGSIQLFFVDASHFVQGGFMGQLWSKVRVFVKTASGRSRYNVLGALNFVNKKVLTVRNDTYITSAQVIMLIDKLLTEYTGQAIKIVLDNAKYQRCKMVIQYAAEHGVELVFLPTYSPNLNLIERLWKFVKSEVLNAAYIGSFADFKNSINECLDNLGSKYLPKMQSLITANFQLYTAPDNVAGLVSAA
jgi:transposase